MQPHVAQRVTVSRIGGEPVSIPMRALGPNSCSGRGETMDEQDEKALTLKEAADRLGLSYRTIFDKRQEIGFRLPGSRVWRVWPSRLAELTRPRNNAIRLSTPVTGEIDP